MENGCITQPGIDTTDIALRGHGRAFYMNYLSFVDGSPWQDNQLAGAFQLQVNGENGVTKLNNRNFCATRPGAQESYKANCGDLLLYILTNAPCALKATAVRPWRTSQPRTASFCPGLRI